MLRWLIRLGKLLGRTYSAGTGYLPYLQCSTGVKVLTVKYVGTTNHLRLRLLLLFQTTAEHDPESTRSISRFPHPDEGWLINFTDDLLTKTGVPVTEKDRHF